MQSCNRKVMNPKLFILLYTIWTVNVTSILSDDSCISTIHRSGNSDSENVCFNKTEVQLLTCQGGDKLVIKDVVQRIKKKRCYTIEECCKLKDNDMFEDTRKCEVKNPAFMSVLNEIIRKCNGRQFCTFLEPKSSIWRFIKEGKHANASHLKISYKCENSDDSCISTIHWSANSDSENVCFNKTEVQLLTCQGGDKLVIKDVVQRIKKKRCSTIDECCKPKDNDMFEDTRKCEVKNPAFMSVLNEIIRKCNGRKFCTLLEPKSSIWRFIKEGKHANETHLKISYKCENFATYEMCEQSTKKVTPPFYISTSSQNHTNCSCDIYTREGIVFLDLMRLTLGSDPGHSLTVGNSTHQHNFIGGRDTIVINRKLGSWSRVTVTLVTTNQKPPVVVLVMVKNTAKNVQLECHEHGPTIPPEIENKNNEPNVHHYGIVMFVSGFFAATCFLIGLAIACVVTRKRISSSRRSALAYIHAIPAETATEPGTDHDIVGQGANRQDGDVDVESDIINENQEHLYSQPIY